MQPIYLTKSQLRIFLLSYQGLITSECLPDKNDINRIEKTVKKLGCIQYDPLNVVGKNPDLVLQSRLEGYKQGDIDVPLYEKRTLIDAWDKMMAIYPVEDFSYFHRLRNRKSYEIQTVLKNRNSEQAIDYCQRALEIISEKGPLLASQIDFGATVKGSWGHGKLSSATLDYLFNIGKLGIHSKRNTQKVYDLIERLIPEKVMQSPDPFESDEAFTKWYIKRRISGFGAYWTKSGGGWLGHFIDKASVRKSLVDEMIDAGELIVIRVEDIKEPFYILAEALEVLQNALDVDIETHKKSVKFLAPLDNLLWDRGLIKELFGFDYVWEVYKPVAIRQYGYYVLPVLYGDRFIARFEPKLYRTGKPFEIESWWWEKDVIKDESLLNACKNGIDNFADYLGAVNFNDYNIINRE